MKMLTIFTPTYNRAYLLPRLFNSLCGQTNKNFEWLIIDDSSTDDTKSVVNEFIKKTNDFNIRYYCQPHGGKHRAINKALGLAEGEYFFIVDSDDYLTEDSVELIYQWTASVEGMENIAAVSGLRKQSNNVIYGGDFLSGSDKEYIDAGNLERKKYHLTGDKAEVYKTDILRNHLFPEFEGEYFVTEAVCWDAIAADGYKIRWFNKPIYICDYLEHGLTKSGANGISGHIKNYNGFCYYVKQCLKVKKITESIHDFYSFDKTVRKMNKTLSQRSHDIGINPFNYLVNLLIMVPIICGFHKVFKRRSKV